MNKRRVSMIAVIALSIGLASLFNAHLVMRFGMRFLVQWSLVIIVGLSTAALASALVTNGQPPLWFWMAYLMLAFFFVGILFGNQNSLAMEPLGRLAGIGAAVVGSLCQAWHWLLRVDRSWVGEEIHTDCNLRIFDWAARQDRGSIGR